MKAPQPLHGQNLPFHEHLHRRRENGIRLLARLTDELIIVSPNAPRHRRATFKAGIGLGVEAAVERIGVLGGALLAHGEGRHGRGHPVIGQVVDDGEARPAVRAVDERIPVAAIVGVEQLAHAVLARGKLGRDERRLFYGIIVGKADLEAVEVLQGHFLDVDLLYAGRGRRIVRELHDELVHQLALALGMNVHAVGSVQHPAVDEVLLRHPVNEGAKPHSLHNALHMNIDRINHKPLPCLGPFSAIYYGQAEARCIRARLLHITCSNVMKSRSSYARGGFFIVARAATAASARSNQSPLRSPNKT